MERNKKIDKYLTGELSAEETQQFESEILRDETLAQEVAAQRDLFRFFKEFDPALENELSDLGDQYILTSKPTNKFWTLPRWAALGFTLMAVVIFFLWNKNQEIAPSDQQKESIIEAKDALNTEEIIPQTTTILKVEETTTPDETKPTIPQKDKPKSNPNRQIASLNPTDFALNPAIESMIDAQFRADELNTQLSIPKNNETLTYTEPFDFQLKGQTNGSPPYRFKLFSNKAIDFDEDNWIVNVLIEGKSISDTEYEFEFEGALDLDRGLYYLILQTENELLSIHKFSLK